MLLEEHERDGNGVTLSGNPHLHWATSWRMASGLETASPKRGHPYCCGLRAWRALMSAIVVLGLTIAGRQLVIAVVVMAIVVIVGWSLLLRRRR